MSLVFDVSKYPDLTLADFPPFFNAFMIDRERNPNRQQPTKIVIAASAIDNFSGEKLEANIPQLVDWWNDLTSNIAVVTPEAVL